MKYLAVLLSLILLAAEPLFAHFVERRPGQAFQFPVSNNASGIQEKDIRFLLAILDSEYASQINNVSKPWTSGFDWQQPYIGAGSLYDGKNYSMMLWGGLLRAKFMTLGAAASVICHELGHRLGGAPHQRFPGQTEDDWSSSEGQADFFAATVCLPKVFDRLKFDAPDFLKQTFEPVTVSLCKTSENVEKCQWVATSGIDMIESLQVYYDLDVPIADPAFWASEEPAETLVNNYPSYPCRMDIYKNGARDPKAPRLRCWFK